MNERQTGCDCRAKPGPALLVTSNKVGENALKKKAFQLRFVDRLKMS